MKAFIFVVLLTVFAYLPNFAQVSLERQVLGVVGSSSTAGNVQLSATAGEAVSTTLISGSLILTQGFQQDDRNFGADALEDLLELVVDFQVFPNPTTDLLTVRFESEKMVELHLRISDLTGRQIAGLDKEVKGQGQLESSFSIGSLAEGMYLLSFVDTNGQVLLTHKIQKR
ncbi:MAG: T9SS type A sorting domain-containing protein [Bacteroidota bacterium]